MITIDKLTQVTSFIQTARAMHDASPYGGMLLHAIVASDDRGSLESICRIDRDIVHISQADAFDETMFNGLQDDYVHKPERVRVFLITPEEFKRIRISWNSILDLTGRIKE